MKIWIDIDSVADVLFFKPMIKALEDRGHEVLVTERFASMSC